MCILQLLILKTFLLYTILATDIPSTIEENAHGIILVELGINLGSRVRRRIKDYLSPFASCIEHRIEACPSYHHKKKLVISLGDAPISYRKAKSVLSSNDPEAFVLFSWLDEDTHTTYITANGNKITEESESNVGGIIGAYEVLQHLGFAFFHPLQPITPKVLKKIPPGLEITESPKWPFRAFHVHTQHPLELTEVLQGFAAPVTNVDKDKLSSEDMTRRLYGAYPTIYEEKEAEFSRLEKEGEEQECCPRAGWESWESMVGEVELFFEWCVANRLNAVEWLLLGDSKWGEANKAEWRAERLTHLVHLGQDFGLRLGVDVPLALQQQHAWFIVDPSESEEVQHGMIRSRLNWVLSCGFDFISSEAGLSEFTNQGDQQTLSLLNHFADYANNTWGVPSFIKIHCSQGQTCSSFKDPRDEGRKLNYNFLPTYATPNLGVMPHTVQAYGFEDHAAHVYGNENFLEMYEYLEYEAHKQHRQVLYYGETAYWVNVDIDVPLFLPVYPFRRLADLRKIGRMEEEKGVKIEGMMNFDSGWEWGYWFNDYITARASWDPHLGNESDEDAMQELMTPLCNAFGPEVAVDFCEWLLDLSKMQLDILLHGQINGQPSPNIKLLSGIAYLAGWDTWVDIPRLIGVDMTQPNKVLFRDYLNPYRPYVLPLLEAMHQELSTYVERITKIRAQFNDNNLAPEFGDLLDEFVEGTALLSLRARHVLTLYQAVSSGSKSKERYSLLEKGRNIIEEAQEIVWSRERHYRVPLSRIAGWRVGPTVYRYGYLWAVHRLYYWWRDQGVAEQGGFEAALSPCYLNRMDPTEVAFGWGKYLLQVIRVALGVVSPVHADSLTNCLAPPLEEYEFPRDLHRY